MAKHSLILFVLLLTFATGYAPNQHQQAVHLDTISLTESTSPTEAPPPIFVVNDTQVRKAFDEAELRGEKKQAITVGTENSITINAKDQMGKLESVNFSIIFLPPLHQARAAGYSFGLVAKNRTPADRLAFENLSVSSIIKHSNEVTFKVFLQQPTNEDAAIPLIHFELIDKNGNRVVPLSEPSSYVAGKDIIGSVALAENGQPVTFPLFSASPNISATMKTITLVVKVDESETSLQFAL